MKKKKFTWLKILFVIALLLIILYTFWGSWSDIVNQLTHTSATVLLMVATSSVVYHLFEGWITCSLAKRYNPNFRYGEGFQCAFYCSFYRLATLGSGQGVAAVVFLGRKNIEHSKALGLYLIQYMLHKISIAIFSGIFFLINWKVMIGNYKSYIGYLLLAYGLTVAICIGLILLAVYPRAHSIILGWVHKLNRRHKWDDLVKKLDESAEVLEKSASELLTDAKTIIACVLKTLAKLCFWYCIPFLILLGSGQVNLLSSLSVTSLSVMTATVIPTPAGIGSTELIMTRLFRELIARPEAAAVTLLYRIATFIFPFVVGGIVIIVARIYGRIKKPTHPKH